MRREGFPAWQAQFNFDPQLLAVNGGWNVRKHPAHQHGNTREQNGHAGRCTKSLEETEAGVVGCDKIGDDNSEDETHDCSEQGEGDDEVAGTAFTGGHTVPTDAK